MATVKQTARLFPTAKSTNLQTVKKKKKSDKCIKGQMGSAGLICVEGFHILFVAVTPLNRRLLTSWVLQLVRF